MDVRCVHLESYNIQSAMLWLPTFNLPWHAEVDLRTRHSAHAIAKSRKHAETRAPQQCLAINVLDNLTGRETTDHGAESSCVWPATTPEFLL